MGGGGVVCVCAGGGGIGQHTCIQGCIESCSILFPQPPFKSKPHVFSDMILSLYMIEITLTVCYALRLFVHGLKVDSNCVTEF